MLSAFHSPRGQLYVALSSVLILAIFAWTWFLSSYRVDVHETLSHVSNIPAAGIFSQPKEITYRDALQALYRPMRIPIKAEQFIDSVDGTIYPINNSAPSWSSPLGKEICIVDIDTRALDEENHLFNEWFNWQQLDGVSNGMLNHYIYASIHGYDYRFINPTTWPNGARDNVWTKVPALREILKDYRIVLMIDADAIFRHLHLPFEWLLNRWNFTAETSIAMPWDVEFNVNDEGWKWPMGYTSNNKGDLNPNAGVVIAQNLPRTFEILDSWISCPDNPDFEDCARFHHGWPAEQGAFGEFVRYKYNLSTDFNGFSCDDANGFPSQRTECQGRFIRHFTTGKDQLKSGVGDAMLQTFMARTQHEMVTNQGIIVRKNSSEIIEEKYWHYIEPDKEDKDKDDGKEEDEYKKIKDESQIEKEEDLENEKGQLEDEVTDESRHSKGAEDVGKHQNELKEDKVSQDEASDDMDETTTVGSSKAVSFKTGLFKIVPPKIVL
ncbi:uncharacterized protein PV09_06971 [Verruconis gallopava]|uniref:Nucleotide-diphospho-sugar transferase domain-containing protein n=1 Tax=Verruconis gallopava TaxID=253628 RepID=A0A0D1XH17_9PEZI|nr:uncharacterized protein PV09_06971 [Verruconis gallopava]KIW01491.1 hypothetical protein PV09_06971 [Verruconis gallopava]